MKPSAVLLSAVLLFPAGIVSAGEDDGVPWGSADYAQEFSYLRESSPELEESWDSLGEKDQKIRLQNVKAPAAERYKEVLADYKEAMKKWDLRELQKALEGDPKARAGTFSNWIDDEAAEAYLRKFSAVRSTLRKAETQPLEEADVAVLERYLLPNGTKDAFFGVSDQWSDYARFFYPPNGDYAKTKRWEFIDRLMNGKRM